MNTANTVLYIQNEPEQTPQTNPTFCAEMVFPFLIAAASTLRYFFVFSALGLRWSNQLSLQLDQYNETKFNETKVSEMTNEPTFKMGLMGVMMMLAIISKMANYYYAQKNNGEHWSFEQRYVIPFLSSSIIYFGIDFIRGMGRDLSLWLFIATNFTFVPMIFAFYIKQALPTDNNKLIASLRDLKATPFYGPEDRHYKKPTNFERSMNAIGSIVLSSTTIVSVCSAVNRQLTDAVYPMGPHQWSTIPIAAIPAGIGGFVLTEHPRFYHAYLSLMRSLKGGAYTYFTMSSLLGIALQNNSEANMTELDEETKKLIAIISFLAALPISAYSCISSLFRAKENHEANVVLEAKIRNAPKEIKRFFKKISDRCFCKSDSNSSNTAALTDDENNLSETILE